MNAIFTSIFHLVLHALSGIPLDAITKIAAELPALIAKAEADVALAGNGWAKLQAVVTDALPLVPEQYQADAKAVISAMTSVAVLLMRKG